MCKYLAAATVCGLSLWVSASALAGHTYTQTITSDGVPPTVIKAAVEGNNARMEYVQVAENPFTPKGSYMIMKGGPSDIYLVNPAQRTYARFDVTMFTDMANAAQGMMGQVQFKDVSAEVLLDEPGEPIMGYPTRHYRIKAAWTMQMGGMPMSTQTTLEQELWTTTALDLPEMPGGAAGAVGLPPQVSEQAQLAIDGFPLKQVTTQSTKTSMSGIGGGMLSRMMNRAAGGATTSTIEVTELAEIDVPDEMFEVPSGYTETQLFQGGPGMPNLNNVGERPPAVPNLNGVR